MLASDPLVWRILAVTLIFAAAIALFVWALIAWCQRALADMDSGIDVLELVDVADIGPGKINSVRMDDYDRRVRIEQLARASFLPAGDRPEDAASSGAVGVSSQNLPAPPVPFGVTRRRRFFAGSDE